MLPAKNRLNLSKNKFPKNGKRVRLTGEEFDIFFEKSDDFKAAVIVTKQVAKKAVDRNRIRRIITEALRDMDIKGELVIKVKKNIAGQKTNQVKEKLLALLKN